jgi:hypothetical protein
MVHAMSSGYYKQNAETKETLFFAMRLAHDVEITVFGEDGRDHTFSGKAGDDLAFQQTADGDWFPIESYPPDTFENEYDPIGDA